MRKNTKYRISIIVFILFGAGILTWLLISVLGQNINYFYYPRQIEAGEATVGEYIKIGGYVAADSLVQKENSLDYTFRVIDNIGEIVVHYTGILPDLFREGQGVIALGILTENNEVQATEIIAKHDETYLPAELQDIENPY